MKKRVRRIWWTCRRCGDRWGQELPDLSKDSLQRAHLGDEFMQGLCDGCVGKMTVDPAVKTVPKRRPINCG